MGRSLRLMQVWAQVLVGKAPARGGGCQPPGEEPAAKLARVARGSRCTGWMFWGLRHLAVFVTAKFGLRTCQAP